MKALATKVVLIPTTMWLLCLRHPIQVPIFSVPLCPRFAPHEGTKPVHVRLALHVVPALLHVAIADVCQ